MFYPQEAPKLDVRLFKKPDDSSALRQTHVPFSGAPHKHVHGPDRIMLVTDPYGGPTSYYEFQIKDIGFVEELPNLVIHTGDTVTMVRAWVRKTSIGVLCTPFVVDDIDQFPQR